MAAAPEDVRRFPPSVRREAGFQLDRLQHGQEPDDWKPVTSIGMGVREIRIHEPSGAYRIIHLARLADAIHVLHA